MKIVSIKVRLARYQKLASLTTADLARSCKVPYPTLRCWMHDGVEPSGVDMERLHIALDRLEKVVTLNCETLKGLPQRARSAKLKSLLAKKK